MKYLNLIKPIVLFFEYKRSKDRSDFKRRVKGYDSGYLYEKLSSKLPKRQVKFYG